MPIKWSYSGEDITIEVDPESTLPKIYFSMNIGEKKIYFRIPNSKDFPKSHEEKEHWVWEYFLSKLSPEDLLSLIKMEFERGKRRGEQERSSELRRLLEIDYVEPCDHFQKF